MSDMDITAYDNAPSAQYSSGDAIAVPPTQDSDLQHSSTSGDVSEGLYWPGFNGSVATVVPRRVQLSSEPHAMHRPWSLYCPLVQHSLRCVDHEGDDQHQSLHMLVQVYQVTGTLTGDLDLDLHACLL